MSVPAGGASDTPAGVVVSAVGVVDGMLGTTSVPTPGAVGGVELGVVGVPTSTTGVVPGVVFGASATGV